MKPYAPGATTTQDQCKEIGALCYDVGVSIKTPYNIYGDTGSAIMEDVKTSFMSTFDYANAIIYANKDNEDITSSGFFNMLNPNLDAGRPVIIGTLDPWGIFSVADLCDGYGYDNTSIYHHLNMGYNGGERTSGTLFQTWVECLMMATLVSTTYTKKEMAKS